MSTDASTLDTVDTRIGARIRNLRAEQGLTLDALATEADVSRAMLSRIERGESSGTAQLLAKVCNGLGITLAALFVEPAASSPLARHADQPTWRDPASGYLRRTVSPSGTRSLVDVTEIEFPPGATVQFDNTRSIGTEQHVWVLDGTLELALGERTVRLNRGDCFWMPLDDSTRFHNSSPHPVRYAVVLARRSRAPWMPS